MRDIASDRVIREETENLGPRLSMHRRAGAHWDESGRVSEEVYVTQADIGKLQD